MPPALQGAFWRHLLPPALAVSPDPLGLSFLLYQIGIRTYLPQGPLGRIREPSAVSRTAPSRQ